MTQRSPGMFPSDTLTNPKDPNSENCSSVTLRSGRPLKEKEVEKESVKHDIVVEREIEEREPSEMLVEKKKVISSHRKILFPKALAKKNLQKHFSKFLEIFKKLEINIPFSEDLEQMPVYSKFMKDILFKRRKLSEVNKIVLMTEEFNAHVQKKLPQKLKDMWSFTIPVDIEGLLGAKALCDLGASINLMPLSIFKRLDLGEATPTMMSLQLADRSIKLPYGIPCS
ncbi:uncharacterized protein LOC130736420 [Lotus japonicus]|uniref:uncharacterized protein LOC130736420 n=1 Tax=Lotus japonicus TaxID=34305 RepID=UPI00258AE595|nr:uncharacterized protein LOC130736420 [Lotus japonicus]